MNHISSIHIKGYKKFQDFSISLNPEKNILIGSNEAGKSTIFEAINIVLNQQYRNADKSALRDLFNIENYRAFERNPLQENLPKIIIEIEFKLDKQNKNTPYFLGEVYGNLKSKELKYGIRFECKFNEDFANDAAVAIASKTIPLEYYTLSWTTFAGHPYQPIKKPLRFLTIDTTTTNAQQSFNYYNRSLFNSVCHETQRLHIKQGFREHLEHILDKANLPSLGNNRTFGIDTKKVLLENIISIYENSIPLENKGRGMENLIKTKIALDQAPNLDVILIEEPESHLDFITLQKMLDEIGSQRNESQIVVTTHNTMIASRLGLRNILWLSHNSILSLKNIEEKTSSFFQKVTDNSLLQLLIADKIFLVEGKAEYLLLPKFYKSITNRDIKDDNIVIISCNGITYKHYLEVAKATSKRIAVITDNDKYESRIEKAKVFNKTHELQHIFMDESTENWTWEVSLFRLNAEILNTIIPIQNGAQYKVNGKDLAEEPVLGKMLNNKADAAFAMLKHCSDFKVPSYVQEAIKWLSEQS